MNTTTEGSTMSTCPDCYGTGVIEGELCPLCKGRRESGLRVGSRVRLYSGSDTGTITKIGPTRAIVRWDTGRIGGWPSYALQELAAQHVSYAHPADLNYGNARDPHAAVCRSCDWQGPMRSNRAMAEADALAHSREVAS